MTVATGDILRVVATMLWDDGNIMQNVFNAVVTGGGGPWADADIIDDAETWLDDMYSAFTTIAVDVVSGNQLQVYKYDAVGDDWDEVGSKAWGWAPSSVGEQMARGVACLIGARTENADVSGRKYIGALSEAQLVLGLWNATIAAAGLLWAADWITDFVGSDSAADWGPGVWSPTLKELVEFSDSISVTLIPAYQRRRKRGVGA